VKRSPRKAQQPQHSTETEVAERVEVYVEETPESRRARLLQTEREENEARQKQIAANVGTPNPNSAFIVDAEGNLWRKPIVSPKPTVEPPALPKPSAINNVRVIPASNAGKLNSDVWASTVQAEYRAPVAEVAAPMPSTRKASIPAEVRPPAGERYGDTLIARDAAAKRYAELQVRPTPPVLEEHMTVCSRCGDRVSKATVWHSRNGIACVLEGEEKFALQDAGIRHGMPFCNTNHF